VVLGFELWESQLLVRHSTTLSHCTSLVLCWFFFFFFLLYRGLNSGPTPWITLLAFFVLGIFFFNYSYVHTRLGSFLCVRYFWDRVSNYLPGLASTFNPPDFCFLSTWDYRCEPLVPGCVRYFWDRVSRTICLDWPQIAILLISASWVTRITGVSHLAPGFFFFFF
jgi:hypothetical protein